MNFETLNKLRVIDLRELAKKKKLRCFHTLKKKELIELLSKEQEHDEQDKDPERENICTIEKSIPDNIENEINEIIEKKKYEINLYS